MRFRITCASYGMPLLIATLLAACTARLPADVELLSVRTVESRAETESASLEEGSATTIRQLQVFFTSRVNLVRFVTVNSYSLGVEADTCEGPAAPQPLVVSGIYWQDRLLIPGGPDPIRRDGAARDSLVAYSFLLDAEKAAAQPADLCFSVAGGNKARGYRSNTVVIPRGEIMAALETPPGG